MDAEDIWDIEAGFWLDGPRFYRDHMFPGAHMTFPDPVGILRGEAILDGLKDAPRWEAVDMEEKTDLRVGDTLVLSYRATARRDGDRPYAALCSSTYVVQHQSWKLISHQQTPLT